MELDNNQSLDSLVNDGAPSMPTSTASDTPPSFEPAFNPNTQPQMPNQNITNHTMNNGSKTGTKLMIFAVVFAALVALGGIGFGIFQMTNVNKKDSEIKNLKTQIANISSMNSDDSNKKSSDSLPIIKSSNDTQYSILFNASEVIDDSITATLSGSVVEGKITTCKIQLKISGGDASESEDCTIDGMDGDIYKVASISNSQSNTSLVFLMSDGAAYYLKPGDFSESKDISLKNKLNISSPVSDIIEVLATKGDESIAEIMFILQDGSTIPFSEDLLVVASNDVIEE